MSSAQVAINFRSLKTIRLISNSDESFLSRAAREYEKEKKEEKIAEDNNN
ncbi:MAG: hypothetical protein KUG67_02780 [Proteobacteria bacterium]|nr:hypothetical protein [Pseudomonadota bacterium]